MMIEVRRIIISGEGRQLPGKASEGDLRINGMLCN